MSNVEHRPSAEIERELADLRLRLHELTHELNESRLAEQNFPYRVGNRVRCRGVLYHVTRIEALSFQHSQMWGRKVRLNGELHKNETYISYWNKDELQPE